MIDPEAVLHPVARQGAPGHRHRHRRGTHGRTAPPLRGRLGGELATRRDTCLPRRDTESSAIATDYAWGRLGEPSLRSSPPRPYALRARSWIEEIVWYQRFWVSFDTGSSGLFEVFSVQTEGRNTQPQRAARPVHPPPKCPLSPDPVDTILVVCGPKINDGGAALTPDLRINHLEVGDPIHRALTEMRRRHYKSHGFRCWTAGGRLKQGQPRRLQGCFPMGLSRNSADSPHGVNRCSTAVVHAAGRNATPVSEAAEPVPHSAVRTRRGDEP
jgi:hypothetical protein